MLALHLFLTRTSLGRSMRAVSDDPSLARVAGIDVQAVIRWTWFIGAGWRRVAGILFGLTVQIYPKWASTDPADVRSGDPRRHRQHYGAVLGGLIIGLASRCRCW